LDNLVIFEEKPVAALISFASRCQ